MEQFNYTLYIYDFELERFVIRYQANTLKLIQNEINEIMEDNSFVETHPQIKEISFKVLKSKN
jgi:hypothetical protein